MKSYLNFNKKPTKNWDVSNNNSHTLKKQTNDVRIKVSAFDNKNSKTKRKSK
jgi:hypothetical protein